MSFLKIDNDFMLDTSDYNTFKVIGTEGFALYCYFISQQAQKSFCQVNIKMIQDFMNRSIKKPKKLEYKDCKKCNVGTMKDIKTIVKYINLLKDNNLIDLERKKTYGINEFLTIKTKIIETTNFTKISEELFVDYIYKIGHIGWSLLYILTKLHNEGFGSNTSEGYAKPTEKYLKSVIKRDVKTIRAYLYLLQEYGLINISKQDPIYKGLDKYGKEFYEYLPNNYIVKNRLMDNKYYISSVDKE